MSARKKALVAGGLGVIGRNLVEYLSHQDDWEVIGLSRRAPPADITGNYLSVDLLDPSDVRAKLGGMDDITHIFHAAYQEHSTPQALVDANLGMLSNLVESVAQGASSLRRVVLYEGAKYYGAHLGPFKTPARENDPRHLPPNFYYDMQDWLLNNASGQPWDAVVLRPDVVCGYAIGNPMNLAMVIAVYATVCKALGLPLRFPGTPVCYGKLAQVTDAMQLARGSVWAATKAPPCAAYNVTNGDLFRWYQLWEKVACWFEMPLAEPQTIVLSEYMADKAALWRQLVDRHGLQDVPYDQIASWGFGDFVFRCDWDVVSSTTLIRQAGFHDCVDSIQMFLDLFQKFRERRLIP